MITNQSSIAPNFATRIGDIHNQFQFQTVPSLITLIDVFRGFQSTLPYEIHDCLQADIVRMTDEALVLRNTLELC